MSSLPPTGPQQPHPFILFVVLPLLLFLMLIVAAQASVLFSLPLWVFWISGGVIFVYAIVRDTQRQLQPAAFTVHFTDSTLFHDRFMRQMARIGFTVRQVAPDYYVFDINARSSARYGMALLIPAAWFRIEMQVAEKAATLTGSQLTIRITKSLLQRQVQQEQGLTLPY